MLVVYSNDVSAGTLCICKREIRRRKERRKGRKERMIDKYVCVCGQDKDEEAYLKEFSADFLVKHLLASLFGLIRACPLMSEAISW